MSGTLIINEIFLSIQGEGTRAGRPCTLIRLTGCNLRCDWCDTRYSWNEGRPMGLDEIVAEVRRLGCRLVELTGGEPLLQDASRDLMRLLCDDGCEVLVETNGSLDIGGVDRRVARIVDVKCPSSGQQDKNRWENIPLLTPGDELKFVIAGRGDYEYARRIVGQLGLERICPVTFSPVLGAMPPAMLADWIVQDLLPVRLGLQLHKIIWPDKERGV